MRIKQEAKEANKAKSLAGMKAAEATEKTEHEEDIAKSSSGTFSLLVVIVP